MKRIILMLLCTVFLLAFPMTSLASDNDGDGVSITVVIPRTAKEVPTAVSQQPINQLYPIGVWESREGGRREIIKTYELNAWENPADIPRESFTREGWLYELTDITRKETASADAREHTETVTIDTETNELAEILQLLTPDIEYQADDGYTGELYLDITSIQVETAGTRTSSHTVTATREYPNLSSNDLSLVPKTITENGRTLTLAGVDWRSQMTAVVDYAQIPTSYTAIARYTGTASRTTVIGYTTTAEYHGTVSKIIPGKTLFTAYFLGVPIVTPVVNKPSADTSVTAVEPVTEPIPAESGSSAETELMLEAENPPETEPNSRRSIVLPILFTLLAGSVCGGALAYYYLFKRKKTGDDSIPENDNEANHEKDDETNHE